MLKIQGEERLFFDTASKIVYELNPDGTYSAISTKGDAHVHVKDKDNEPEVWADGNTSGSIAAGDTLVLGDLTIYGYPYKTLTFTNAHGSNAATIIWGVAQGVLFFQIAGTTPDIDLTATNTNDDAFTDVPVIKPLTAGTPVTGQTMGAGNYVLYRS